MKKSGKILLITTLCLFLVGVCCCAAGLAMGARIQNFVDIVKNYHAKINGDLVVIDNEYFAERMLDEPAWQGNYSIDEQEVSDIYVYWTAGSVDIGRSDEDGISFSEMSVVELLDEEKLQYSVHDSVLVISYSGAEEKDIVKLPEKALKLSIPESANVKVLKVDSSSAEIEALGIKIDEISISNVSGKTTLGAQAKSVDIFTTSGDVKYKGVYGDISVEAVSGSIDITSDGAAKSTYLSSSSGDVYVSGNTGFLTTSSVSGDTTGLHITTPYVCASSTSGEVYMLGNISSAEVESVSGSITLDTAVCPESIDVDSTSGEVKLIIPENSSFELEFETSSGELSSDLPMKNNGVHYIEGSGLSEIDVETTSGDLSILAK